MESRKNSSRDSLSPRVPKWIAVTALGCVLVLAGCAGNPPTTELAVASQAIDSADTAGGTQYAPTELRSARDKLAAAERAVNDNEYEKALRLAQQAEWDARVAERKAQAEKTQRALRDAREGVQDLREESFRGVR